MFAHLITQEIPILGRVTLSTVSIGMLADAEQAAGRAGTNKRADTFTNTLLACMFQQPQMTPDEVATLSPDALAAVVDLAVDSVGLREEFDQTVGSDTSQERFYQAYLEHNREQQELISEMVGQIPIPDPSFLEMLDRAYAITKSDVRRLSDIAQVIKRANTDWQETLSGIITDRWQEQWRAAVSVMSAIKAQSLISHDYRSHLADIAEQVSNLESVLGNYKYIITDSSLIQLGERLSAIQLPEPYLSSALVVSDLNSTLLHSPTYSLPSPFYWTQEAEAEEELEELAEDAFQRRRVDAYDIVSQLERSLRGLVQTKLEQVRGPKWWRQAVPEAVWRACEERKQINEGPLKATYHPIEYAYFDDYKAIIVRKDNWEQFTHIFGNDKSELEVVFKWVGTVRNSVAHSRSLSDDEYAMLVVAANWIQTRINASVQGVEE